MGYIVTPLVAPYTIWLTRGPFSTATSLGLHLGWFEQAFAQEGFQVSALQDSRDAMMRVQHVHHTIKTLIREGGNVLPIWQRARRLTQDGRDNTVVVGFTGLEEVEVLLARPGAGLRPHDPSSLRGKRLGLSKAAGDIDVWRAMSLRAFDTGLRVGGLAFDDVVLTNVAAPPIQWQGHRRLGGSGLQVTQDALLRGEVDVIFAKGAEAIALQAAHELEVVLDLSRLEDPALRVNNGAPRPITVHRHLLNDNPELVATYLLVLNAVAGWARSHPGEVAEVIAADTGMPAETVRRGHGPRLGESLDVNLDAARVAALQSQVDFLHRQGLTDARFDVEGWIDPGPLQAALAAPLSLNGSTWQTNLTS